MFGVWPLEMLTVGKQRAKVGLAMVEGLIRRSEYNRNAGLTDNRAEGRVPKRQLMETQAEAA